MSEDRTIALPPIVDPQKWEDFGVFRETFLLLFTRRDFNDALRGAGRAIFDVTLAAGHDPLLPDLPGGYSQHELAAAAADLRHLEGYFLSIVDERTGLDRDDPNDRARWRLTQLAADSARRVAKIAATIEEAVRP